MAPATRKLAAALQSLSRSISAASNLCPPFTLNTISVQRDQSPPDSMKSLPPSISLPILMPNFFSTSTVMNIYGILFGSRTMSEVFFCEKGRAISRPEIICEPCFPDISARVAVSGPFTINGTRTGSDAPSSLPFVPLEAIVAPRASITSRAPVSGRSRRVFSPVNST